MSRYPNGIDDNTTLPPASGDDAPSVNATIGAIEAVERELGILPSGVYADVRTRLDILEARGGGSGSTSEVGNPFYVGISGVTIQTGVGDPNVVVTVPPTKAGSLYLRQDGYNNLYVFELDGYWHETTGSQGVAPQPSWLVSNWYVDPVNGNDNNSGETQLSPVKTVMGGIVARWGTLSPILPQTTTIHLLSSQPTGAEAIFLNPNLIGNGPSVFVIDGTLGLAQIGATFNCGAVTAKVRGNPGTLLQVAGMPVGAQPGMLIQNITQGCYAFIDSMIGSTATLTQPFDAASLTTVNPLLTVTEIDSWTANDQCKVFKLPQLNLKSLQPVGGDASTIQSPGMWIMNILIPDVSGAPGNSGLIIQPIGIGTILSNCRIDPFFYSLGASQDVNMGCYNCWVPGGGIAFYSGFCGGALCSINTAYGVHLYDLASVDGDIIIHGGLYCKGFYNIVGYAYLDGLVPQIAVIHGNIVMLEADGSGVWTNSTVWGPGTINLEGPNSGLYSQSGQSWALTLLCGQVTLDSVVTGSAIIGQSIINNIKITAANLDTYGRLSDFNVGNHIAGTAVPLATTPPALSQTDWYVDPAAGNDANSGLIGFPVQTIMGGIVNKWGTDSPILKQNTTIHLLGSQTLNQEAVILRPTMVNGSYFAIIGTPILVSSFTLGTVTAKNRATPQLLTAGGFTAGGLQAGQLVENSTHSSHAFTQSIVGGVATLTQPLAPLSVANLSTTPASPPAAEVDSWLAGDSVSVYNLPLINLKVFEVKGGDTVSPSFVGGANLLQFLYIPDITGTDGSSVFRWGGTENFYWMVDCRVGPWLDCTGPSWNDTVAKLAVNCFWNGSGNFAHTGIAGGAINTTTPISSGFTSIDADTILSQGFNLHNGGVIYLGKVYIAGELDVHESKVELNGGPLGYGSGILWGTAFINVEDDGTFHNDSGPYATSVLLTGGLKLDGGTTGTTYAPGSPGVWTDGVSLTQTHIDSNGGMQNPRSGSKYT